MAKLNICMMLHYEDKHGKVDLDPDFYRMTSDIIKISSIYKGENAKLSYQFSQKFSERIINPGVGGPLNIVTPVSVSLGHNYWTHIHSSTSDYAVSARHALASVIAWNGAYSENEALSHIMGSSGGPSFTSPGSYDWFEIAHDAGYKVKNSVVWGNYDYAPRNRRPYQHSDTYIKKWYMHRAAPVPYHIPTYRTVYRMSNASQFNVHSDTGSVGNIPHAAPWGLHQLTDGFLPSAVPTPTAQDFQYALSQIVSIANQTVDTETNSFYLMMNPDAIRGDDLLTMHANFIDSVNASAVTPGDAEWKNMNEIWSAFES